MTTPARPSYSPRSKRAQYQLFRHSSPPEFQNEFLRLYEQVKQVAKMGKSARVLYPTSSRKDAISPKKVAPLECCQKIDGLPSTRRVQHMENLAPSGSAYKSPQKLRAITCNKQSNLLGGNSSKKGKTKVALMKPSQLFQDKDSGSKKSTDVSMNKQQLILANQQYQENLKQDKDRIRRLLKEIREERKRQEIEIFLFQKSIELLRKRTSQNDDAELQQEATQLCQQMQDCVQQFSSLEIESD